MICCPKAPVCEILAQGWFSTSPGKLFKIQIAQPPLQTESGIGMKSESCGLPFHVPRMRKPLGHWSLFNIHFIHHHAFNGELKMFCIWYLIYAHIWMCGNHKSRRGGFTNVSMAIIYSLVSMVRFIRTLKFTLFKILNYFSIDQTHKITLHLVQFYEKEKAKKEIERKVIVINQFLSWWLILCGNELEYQRQMM